MPYIRIGEEAGLKSVGSKGLRGSSPRCGVIGCSCRLTGLDLTATNRTMHVRIVSVVCAAPDFEPLAKLVNAADCNSVIAGSNPAGLL